MRIVNVQPGAERVHHQTRRSDGDVDERSLGIQSPSPQSDGQSRAIHPTTVAYFAHATDDTLIRCIPTCKSNDTNHPPLFAGEHRAAKVKISQQVA
jgi:hypothetical protein